MKRIKTAASWVAWRMIMLAVFILMPIAALMALPWAWWDSRGAYGYTFMVSIREEITATYSRKALIGLIKYLFSWKVFP